jgi:hypothetical protein
MAYTGSKSISGLGTILGIGATPTTIGEVIDITQSGRAMKTDATTNLQSAAEEFIGTIRNEGAWDVSLNRVASDAGQIALEAAFVAGLPISFTLTEPKGSFTTSGPKWVFNAVVTEAPNWTFSGDKNITGKCKLQVSGAIVQTAGS